MPDALAGGTRAGLRSRTGPRDGGVPRGGVARDPEEQAHGTTESGGVQRLRLSLGGAVQGVGFRPFVYRLACELALAGHVENSPSGVCLEIEGPPVVLAAFTRRLRAECPTHAAILEWREEPGPPLGTRGFTIRASDTHGASRALVQPDLATCADCLTDIFTPGNRRYRYPFTNCTACGPRYSIVHALPYDRARTTLARFPLCAECAAEYETPGDRRFHAEPTACPACGPQLALWDARGQSLARGDVALRAAADAVRAGAVVALKGLGGFQLVVDARHEPAVTALRTRKRRDAKPFALMLPDLAWAQRLCRLEALERALLTSAEAPIVLARRGPAAAGLAVGVAPGNPYLGVMLPYTPLHHLLLAELGFPIVATSGNLSEEPLCIDEREALERLHGLADVFLVHDRPIARPVDDSVVRVVAGRALLLRRARGYAPMSVATLAEDEGSLAFGGQLKNTLALAHAGCALMSPHLGDLEDERTLALFHATWQALAELHGQRPRRLACDLHPDYLSTQAAQATGLPVLRVQHHHAHALACLADNALPPPALAIVWDGNGYGDDGTLWGGEWLHLHALGYTRLGWLRPFPLPGGERALREPRRALLGLLFAQHGEAWLQGAPSADAADARRQRAVRSLLAGLFRPSEQELLLKLLRRHVNAPLTSAVGRLFDAIAALLGLAAVSDFEGQAAMALEFACEGAAGSVPEGYAFELRVGVPRPRTIAQALGVAAPSTGASPGWVADWGLMLLSIEDALAEVLEAGLPARAAAGSVAPRFHETLAALAASVAARCAEPRVLLTGGCFQNRVLTERTLAHLQRAGLEGYTHRAVPPNDGGLALGQLVALLGPRSAPGVDSPGD